MNNTEDKLNTLLSETSLQPLKIYKGSSDFRYRILEIISTTKRNYYHVDDMIKDAEKLINWVNNELKITDYTH